jgi:hypothetical protein
MQPLADPFMWLTFLVCGLMPADPVDFDRAVAPILAGRCLDCHTGAAAKGGLDLSTAKGVIRGGKGGPAVVAGKPAESLLWDRIVADEMPPRHPLPEAERAVLKKWIESGAKWGSDPIDPFRFTSASRAGADWWSLKPVARPVVPRKAAHPIDAFVRAGLESKTLKPSPPADRRTWIRRVTFDLTGLPPTPEEVDRFVADASPDAESKLVERLLASPHYGERGARHWLDVAHFGESDGYEFDKMRPHAWRYRDWVVGALNADIPYDRFARLQIAGDVLEPNSTDAVIATGFLVGGAHDSLLPAGDVMKQIMRQDELEDLVGLVGQTFLGLTVNCARCHDHKFDPIRQSDYYRLAAALAGVSRGDRAISLPIPAGWTQRLAKVNAELAAIETPVRERILKDRAAGTKVRPTPPSPIASWDFSRDLRDTVGTLHGTAVGNAKVDDGALRLDGTTYVTTPPVPVTLREKTFEAWVKLDTLDQRGGGVIGIQSPDGNVFDALVYGEREPGRWAAGSESFRRTRDFAAPAETEASKKFVHVAMTYAADGTVTAYREGIPYGTAYRLDKAMTFDAKGSFRVQFGLRHSPAVGNRLLTGSIQRAKLYDRALSAGEIALSAGSADFVSETELVSNLSPANVAERFKLAKERAELESRIHDLKSAQTFAVTPQKAGVTHRLNRGNPGEPAEPVSAGGLSALPGHDFGLPADAPEAERRRKLAEWVASEKNPLFARTIVNRVWQHHFGRGLVETANDLGFSGGATSHPELLDWLASEFVARKWSLKALHRLIVSSESYRQSSRPRDDAMAVDAENRLLWRYSPRRLDAEALRDATLSVAGQLNPAIGGKSYFDVRPFIFRTSQFYEPLDPVGPEFNRRSLYRMSARGGKNPLLDSFDCPDTATITPKRASTTTPLQALVLMNNSFMLRMTDHFAARLRTEAGPSADDQIRLAFRLTYGRPAKESELDASREVVTRHGLSPFCRAILNANGFLYVH